MTAATFKDKETNRMGDTGEKHEARGFDPNDDVLLEAVVIGKVWSIDPEFIAPGTAPREASDQDANSYMVEIRCGRAGQRLHPVWAEVPGAILRPLGTSGKNRITTGIADKNRDACG